MKQAGYNLPDDRIVEGKQTPESGGECIRALLSREHHPPEAIACNNDMMALGAMDELVDRGLRVPEDVALVGYDDMSFASSRKIELTTMHMPRRLMGSGAVEALLLRMSTPKLPPQEILLPQHLVVRLSCGNTL
jgi:DNA-binding LacI/PurR family transcriptional regulator